MLKIESDRLLLYPIGDMEMKGIIENEKDPDLKKAYSEMLQGCIRESENRIWYAIWHMEMKNQSGVIVGELSFKGIHQDGMVEIGYGIREGYGGIGYMTEAIKTISEWALSQKDVTRIEAETDPDNKASQRVLFSAGYVPTGNLGEEGPRFVLIQSETESRDIIDEII